MTKLMALLIRAATALFVPALIALMAIAPFREAAAATPNYALAYNVITIPLHISGQYTTSQTAVARFAMPFPCEVIGVGASARASGGTSPTLTVDLKAGGLSILSSAFAVTAGAYSEGAVATSAVADEAAMTVDLTIGGTSPTWNDITVLVTVVRK